MILGVDVSKKTVDVALFEGKETRGSGSFSNTLAGFKKLSTWLDKRGASKAWICLEATGNYGFDLAEYFSKAGHKVSVVNPAQIKKYAESQLRRNKNDKLDARIIADFCRTQEPADWTPPSPQKQALQAMVRRLNDLVAQRTQEINRLKALRDCPAVRENLEDSIAFLDQQMTKLEGRIEAHIHQYPDLKADFDLIVSVPGIAAKTASILLAELPDISRFNSVGQVVAYVGLCPQQHTSGSSVRKKTRLTKIGKSSVKTALFYPALVALRYNPIVHTLGQRLEKRGKAKMVIVGAAMRKLIQLVYGILKSRVPFDPNYATLSQDTP